MHYNTFTKWGCHVNKHVKFPWMFNKPNWFPKNFQENFQENVQVNNYSKTQSACHVSGRYFFQLKWHHACLYHGTHSSSMETIQHTTEEHIPYVLFPLIKTMFSTQTRCQTNNFKLMYIIKITLIKGTKKHKMIC